MSKPRYKWWGYIKNVIRDYPRLKQEYEALHEQSITPNMSGMPVGGEISRMVEKIAIRELPGTKQREYEAVRRAIAATQRLDTARETLDIIDMVFWKNTHTLSGAAYQTNLSYETAKRYQRRFIAMVARNYGLLDEEKDKR